jgi:hypothetical protein
MNARPETDGFTKVRLARKVAGLRDPETITSREFALFEARHDAVRRKIDAIWSRTDADRPTEGRLEDYPWITTLAGIRAQLDHRFGPIDAGHHRHTSH